MGSELARLRPDLRTAHFTHTPFADPSVLRMLPTAVGAELLDRHGRLRGLRLPHRPMGRRLPGRPGHRRPRPEDPATGRPTFVSPLSTDPDQLRRRRPTRRWPGPWPASRSRSGAPTARSSSGWTGWSCRRTCCAGSGRSRSCWRRQPHRRERVVLRGAGLPDPPGPARVPGLPERGRVDGGPHQPAVGHAGLDADRARGRGRLPPVAGRPTRYDVLLVNPVRDGLNLVAKEGPLLNARHGVLALSREAGRLRRAGRRRSGDQPVRRVGHRRGAGPRPSTWTPPSGRPSPPSSGS